MRPGTSESRLAALREGSGRPPALARPWAAERGHPCRIRGSDRKRHSGHHPSRPRPRTSGRQRSRSSPCSPGASGPRTRGPSGRGHQANLANHAPASPGFSAWRAMAAPAAGPRPDEGKPEVGASASELGERGELRLPPCGRGGIIELPFGAPTPPQPTNGAAWDGGTIQNGEGVHTPCTGSAGPCPKWFALGEPERITLWSELSPEGWAAADAARLDAARAPMPATMAWVPACHTCGGRAWCLATDL